MDAFLKKVMPKMQKPLIIGVAILSAVFFVYSLVFSTDIYPLKMMSNPESIYVSGAEMYDTAQLFNKILFPLTIVLLLSSITLFIYYTQKRRLFYKSNYIVSIIFCALGVLISIFVVVWVIYLRSLYLKIDFEMYKLLTDSDAAIINARYVKSTFFFDLGIVLAAIMITSCVFVVLLLIYKYRLKKWEKAQREEAQ